MIGDEVQMVELLKAVRQNPEAAAKMLASSGLTPEQVLSMGAPSMGQIMPPVSEAGISSQPPRYSSFMQMGSATPGPSTPTDRFTLPAGGEVPMPQPAVTRNLTDEYPLPNMGGDPMMTTAWNQPTPGELAQMQAPVGAWQTAVTPEAQPGLGNLMAGLKGLSPQSADTRPIFGANAPAPRDIIGSSKMVPGQSMDQILKLLMGGVKGPVIPTLGSLMGR